MVGPTTCDQCGQNTTSVGRTLHVMLVYMLTLSLCLPVFSMLQCVTLKTQESLGTRLAYTVYMYIACDYIANAATLCASQDCM